MTPPDAAESTPGPADAGRPPGRRLVALAAGTGLLAGLAAWAAGETPVVVAQPVGHEVNFFGSGVMVPAMTPEAELAAARRTSAATYGVLGGLLGLLLGLLGGATARNARRAAMAGGAGLAVGALLGAGIPWATLPAFEPWRAGGEEALLPALLMHAAFWVPIGAAGGLALGLGRQGRALPAAAGGAAAALVASVVYELCGAMLFPTAATAEPVSATWGTRLLAHVLVATFAAAGAARAAIAPGAHPRP
jgi:hypothetical protein